MNNEERTYISQSAFDKYTGGKPRSTKSRFEDRATFRKDLSVYDMKLQNVSAGENCQYDRKNCSGVPLDYDSADKRLFVDGSDAHTLLIGATGSKKSRLVVMPTVRTVAAAGEGMVICDPKGEMYRRTAGYLEEMGYSVHAINLREPEKGDGWNLLQIPYTHYLTNEIDKACELINDATVSLMPITDKDPYWDMSARDMLFGLVLLLFQICKDKELPPELVNMMSVLKLREELFISTDSREIMRSKLWQYARNYELIRMRLNGVVICPEKTLSCIISTFDQHMTCFSLQPQIVNMLSKSTFNVNGLGFSKVAIYLIMPDEKTTYHKIITIFIKQIYEFLIDNAFKRTKNNRFDVRINFILDEFSSLPTISDFPQMISASRSRNIRFVLVIQSKHQLIQRYKEETDTIMSNCTNWMFLTSRETELLREISELGGITGSNNDRLISMSWLQHLNKEKGECLVFNGRKYPYLAMLPDIDVYDGNAFVFKPMVPRTQVEFTESYNDEHFFQNAINNGEKKIASKETENEFVKFDELFGLSDDE